MSMKVHIQRGEAEFHSAFTIHRLQAPVRKLFFGMVLGGDQLGLRVLGLGLRVVGCRIKGFKDYRELKGA